MTDSKKITALNELTSPSETDWMAIVNSGETKKITVDNLLSSKRFITPDSLTLVAGTSTDNINDVLVAFDGNVYNLNEAAGAPGFDLRFNFSGLTHFVEVFSRFYYAGSATHGCRIQLYNYNTTNWDTFLTVIGNGIDYTIREADIIADTNYIDGSGNAILRFYHTEVGNPAHDVYIDYVALVDD